MSVTLWPVTPSWSMIQVRTPLRPSVEYYKVKTVSGSNGHSSLSFAPAADIGLSEGAFCSSGGDCDLSSAILRLGFYLYVKNKI